MGKFNIKSQRMTLGMLKDKRLLLFCKESLGLRKMFITTESMFASIVKHRRNAIIIKTSQVEHKNAA